MPDKDDIKKQGPNPRKPGQRGSDQHDSGKGKQQERRDTSRRDLSEERQENIDTSGKTGYRDQETQPDQPGNRTQPKVTNQDTSVTNQEEQEDVDENSGSVNTQTDQPEINIPVHGTEKTEKKIPDR